VGAKTWVSGGLRCACVKANRVLLNASA
jgi:hypothetical protein